MVTPNILCWFVLLIFDCTSGQPFFRSDYHYIDSVKAFYKIHTTGRAWSDAKHTCEAEGATLFYPEDEAESAAVRAYVKREANFYNFWIGAAALISTGIFVTIDGLLLSDGYEKWAAGDPNNLGGVEHCVLLEHTGLMYDGKCWQDLRFVCKKKHEPSSTSSIHNTGELHDGNFFRRDYHYIGSVNSFYKIHTIGRPWLDAKRTCELEGATLFYPEDEAESAAVRAYVKKEQDFYNFWIGVDSLTGIFLTTDGVLLSDVYENWAAGDPNNLGGVEHCVLLEHTGLMYDGNCAQNLRFVCKKKLNTLSWNSDCNMPYKGYKYNACLGKCYKFYLTPQNWIEAYRTCASELSYLAIADNPSEEAFFLEQLKNAVPQGNASEFQQGQVHVGVHKLIGNDWMTVKGTPLRDIGASRWHSSQPDGSGKCGSIMYKEGGGLNDISCDRACFFVCEHEVAPSDVLPPYLHYGD